MSPEEKLNLLEQLVTSPWRQVFVEDCLEANIKNIEHNIFEQTDNDKKFSQHDVERTMRKYLMGLKKRPDTQIGVLRW